MNLVGDATTLVLLGKWNPEVLQPKWLAKYAFELGDAEVPVEIEWKLNGPPRFTLQNVLFTPQRQRVLLTPTPFSEEHLDLVQAAAAKVLTALPHTPVNAIGLNFRFEGDLDSEEGTHFFEDVTDDLLELDHEIEIVSRTITASLNIDGRRLNLTRRLMEGKLTLEFNFHKDVTTATEASTFFTDAPDIFRRSYRLAMEVVESLYPDGATNAVNTEH